MTSTSFNIGMSGSKNSSRVLKPPGGGHSDIFGIREGNEGQTPNKRRNHPPTTINSCFMHDESDKKAEIEKEDMKNGNQNDTKTEVPDENTEPKASNENEKEKTEEKEVVPPRRGRVPPGGYSSALW